ncbi:OstA-like protein [Duncaniella muris]|uniref:OstA-like protein n=1 Tax=Duncaniella muris TaxID=2094150 RepID=UPI002674D064|nr:OstA-like protein [Duncaniella muris]
MKLSPLLALAALGIVSLPAMLAQAPKDGPSAKSPAPKSAPAPKKSVVRPTIPAADRHDPGKVFLEKADRLMFDQARDSDVQVLVGNVMFRKGDMFMYCDSARFNEATSSLDAFNNVHMEQGDTLFVYGDELYYSGADELAELRAYPGKKVRLINRDVSLTTDVFFYDLAEHVGYYETGGTLTDKQNILKSLQGYYYPDSKDAFFYLNVDLTGPRPNDTLRMFTDSLTYNTGTNIAQLMCETLIVSKDGEITSTSGFYDTNAGLADLYDRSTVHTRRGNYLTGDTLFYDRNKGYGEAFGNMILTDSAKQSELRGDYGFYDELKDSAFITGNALALEYSQADTLYLHGDTICAYMLTDSTKVTDVFHRVRFFRNDCQGLCDSMSVVERDSILYMYYNPILWYGDKQIVGNVIYAHFNDSTVDWARLPESGVLGQHIGEDCYDQLAGSDMTAWFNDSTIRRLYVEGNVQVIMFPMENDPTYNKFVFTESSTMDAYFNGNEIEKINMWPETTGKATPLYLAKRSAYYLPMFRWYEPLRPMAPAEVFDYPAEMADLKAQKLMGKIRPDAYTVRGTATGRPRPLEPERTALSATLPADSLPADSLQPGSSIGLPDSLGIPEPVARPDSIEIPEPVALPDSIEIPKPADQPEPSAPVDPAPEAPETPDVPEAPSAPTPDAPGTTDIYRKEVIS